MKTHKWAVICLLVFWMSLIFYMSSQTAEVSGENSTEIAQKIAPVIFSDFEKMPEAVQHENVMKLDHVIRKMAHAMEYAVLAILCMMVFSGEKRNKSLKSWLFCVLYATSDEIHQIFVPGRAGMIQDVLIDASGSFFGVLVVITASMIIRVLREKKATQDENRIR